MHTGMHRWYEQLAKYGGALLFWINLEIYLFFRAVIHSCLSRWLQSRIEIFCDDPLGSWNTLCRTVLYIYMHTCLFVFIVDLWIVLNWR